MTQQERYTKNHRGDEEGKQSQRRQPHNIHVGVTLIAYCTVPAVVTTHMCPRCYARCSAASRAQTSHAISCCLHYPLRLLSQ